VKDYKTIDLVINAGVGYRSFVELAEDDKIDQIVNVNLLGVVKCAGLYPGISVSKQGHFINISSIAGFGQFTWELLSCYEAWCESFQNVWPMNY
jgi:NADP-dependent 3-hydroxy acid dehydrogenase YdfG